MIYEFEGRTEKEAIDKAASELGLAKDAFDVEIVESRRGGLFKKGYVKIKIHTNQPEKTQKEGKKMERNPVDPKILDEFEQKLTLFVQTVIEKMGYDASVSVQFREDRKIGLKIDTKYSSILIGKKGKNLDSLQLLANIYAGKIGREDVRVILDTENYRIRREETLVRLAYTVADKVREARNSILLEPMNPFDRRLIHTTLSDIADVETKSEGEGIYKQVRVFYTGGRS